MLLNSIPDVYGVADVHFTAFSLKSFTARCIIFMSLDSLQKGKKWK